MPGSSTDDEMKTKPTEIRLGPVLSFRGLERQGDTATWHVTVLIGIPKDAAAPVVMVEGKECAPPLGLWKTAGLNILRYDCSVTLSQEDRRVSYGIAGTAGWSFTVPAKGAAPRLSYVSCNGFSDPRAARKMRNPLGFVWQDLLSNHDVLFRDPAQTYRLDKEQRWHEQHTHANGWQRFHLLLMGGDQVYLDSIWEDNEALKSWLGLSRDEQVKYKLPTAARQGIEDYYVKLYADRWLPPALKRWSEAQAFSECAGALASIPTVMMWDDHDIFDGWGSYSPDMQACDVFQTLFNAARRAFWVLQLQQSIDDLPPLRDRTPLAATDDPNFESIDWEAIRKQKDPLMLPFLPMQPGFSYAHALGQMEIVAMDLRTERSFTQILGQASWDATLAWLQGTGRKGCQHVLVMSSVPAIHPKLALAENVLDFSNSESVTNSIADDLRDHWTHDDHDGERKRLFRNLVQAASLRQLRVTLVSGDVHVAAWGYVARNDATPATNWLRVHQLTSSAVKHPSLTGIFETAFLSYLNLAADRKQDIDSEYTVEMMLFPGHRSKILAARNWLAMETDSENRLWATWRAEAGDRLSNHLLAIHPVDMKGT